MISLPSLGSALLNDWWVSLYDAWLAELFFERTPDELARTTQFLIGTLGLAAGDRVFDQCCGNGVLGIALGRRGMRVVGVDQARGYVDAAQREAERLALPVTCLCGDAFEHVPAEPCRGAFNWATSFGYADDARNLRMLERAYAALTPGGRFALDTMNVPGVLAAFEPETVLRKTTAHGELVLVRHSRIDPRRGRIDKRWCYTLPDGRTLEHHSSVRLYLPHTLADMLGAVGFRDVTLFGSIAGEPLAMTSPRCIAVGTRP
jgi:SAM-dependent methyltransferase